MYLRPSFAAHKQQGRHHTRHHKRGHTEERRQRPSARTAAASRGAGGSHGVADVSDRGAGGTGRPACRGQKIEDASVSHHAAERRVAVPSSETDGLVNHTSFGGGCMGTFRYRFRICSRLQRRSARGTIQAGICSDPAREEVHHAHTGTILSNHATIFCNGALKLRSLRGYCLC